MGDLSVLTGGLSTISLSFGHSKEKEIRCISVTYILIGGVVCVCVLYMYQYIKLSGHFWAGCPLVVISSIDGGFVLKSGCGHPRYF